MPSIRLPRRRVESGQVVYRFGKEELTFQSQSAALDWARSLVTRDTMLAIGIIAEHRLRVGGLSPATIEAKTLSIELDAATSMGIT